MAKGALILRALWLVTATQTNWVMQWEVTRFTMAVSDQQHWTQFSRNGVRT